MTRFKLAALGACLATLPAFAQEITPIWVQTINESVGVTEANKLPILKNFPDMVYAMPGGVLLDGREPITSLVGLFPFDSTRAVVAIRENGIDEQDPNLPQAQKDLAAQFPDRSLVFIDIATGKPGAVAWKESLRAGDEIGYDVTLPNKGAQTSKVNALWRPAMDENPDPTKRAIYSGYKHLIMRYAPKADGTGWETTPTIAWEEPLSGLSPDGSTAAPEYGIGDGLTGTVSTGGEQGSWRSYRLRDLRVSGYGNSTKILAGGATWRIGQHPQLLVTTDGLKFTPAARVDNRNNGARRNDYALGGQSSRVVNVTTDPARPGLEVVYGGHYPGTGWGARPNRYVSDPAKPIATPEYNQQPNVRLFPQNEAASPGLPAFTWEAAGKDGIPFDNDKDGIERYDGNWSMSIDTTPSLDYLVSVSSASYDNGSRFTYGWLGIHRLDGSIASGNSSYKLNYMESDAMVDYGGSAETDLDGTDSWVQVVPDTTAPANLDKAMALVAFGNGGFGVFTIQNVAATLVTSPANQTVTAGSDVTIAANVTGSPNDFQWYHNGVPVPVAPYYLGAKKMSLKIVGVTPADAGTYQLKWTNPLSGAGETATMTLTVNGKFVRWTEAKDIVVDSVNMPIITGELIENANSFTLKGGGYKWTDTADVVGDNGYYRYESVSGDFDKKVRLVSLAGEPAGELTENLRASLMIRENTDPKSRTLELAALNPWGNANQVRVMGRSRYNQRLSATRSRSYGGLVDNLPNQWLRVRRVGNTFDFFVGKDGVNWSLISQQYEVLPSTVLVGTYATTDNEFGTTQTIAEFADYGDVASTEKVAPQLVSAGTIDKKLVGVKFSEPVNSITATKISNYAISQGTITMASMGIGGDTVYLTVAGLTSDTFTVTVGGIVDTAGNPIAANSTVSAKKSNWTSTDIGYIQDPNNRPKNGDDPYLVGQAVAVSSDANPEVEIIGGGSNAYNIGDYMHYLYREYPGDFDVVVAVNRFDKRGYAGGYANGGIHVRKALYRTDNTAVGEVTKVPAYVNITYYEASGPNRAAIQLNRPNAGDGYGNNNPRANTEEINGLLGYFTGLRATDAAGTLDPKSSPTEAKWLRVQRTGTSYSASFSYDGQTWVLMDDATADMANLSGPVLVGFGHQNDTGYGVPPDNTYAGSGTVDADGKPTQNESSYGVVRISHFGDFATAFPPDLPTMSLSKDGANWKITYTGTLQSSGTANTGYTDVQGATSPFTVPTTSGTQQFYRARK